jgi:DNA polymerase-3 subunit alpha
MQIRYGLGAIKGVGSQIADEIHQCAPYDSLYGLVSKVPKINRRITESLIKSGACDVWQQSRAILLASVDRAISSSAKDRLNSQLGQVDLFADEQSVAFEYAQARDRSLMQVLRDEYDALGYYLSAHPVDACKDELAHLSVKKIATLAVSQNTIKIAGVLTKLKTVRTKKGSRIAFGEFGDGTANVDVAFFDDVYQESYETLSHTGVLICEGSISVDQYTQNLRMQCSRIRSLDDLRENLSPSVLVEIEDFDPSHHDALIQSLKAKKGSSKVYIKYCTDDGIAKFMLPDRISVSDEWVNELSVVKGVKSVDLHYA